MEYCSGYISFNLLSDGGILMRISLVRNAASFNFPLSAIFFSTLSGFVLKNRGAQGVRNIVLSRENVQFFPSMCKINTVDRLIIKIQYIIGIYNSIMNQLEKLRIGMNKDGKILDNPFAFWKSLIEMKHFWQAVKFSNLVFSNSFPRSFDDNQEALRFAKFKTTETRNERVSFVAVERMKTHRLSFSRGLDLSFPRLNVAKLQPSIPYHSVTRIFDVRLHD